MTALVKLLHLIFKQHAKKNITIRPDMMTAVAQNVALLILVHT